jgi:hypothetical protein
VIIHVLIQPNKVNISRKLSAFNLSGAGRSCSNYDILIIVVHAGLPGIAEFDRIPADSGKTARKVGIRPTFPRYQFED